MLVVRYVAASSLLALAVGTSCKSAPADNADACNRICACAAGQGVDEATCNAVCKATSAASTTPAADCQADLLQANASACVSGCSDLTDPAPGDMLGECGAGVAAMKIGDSFVCTLPSASTVDYLALLVGCNDGETGTFTATFDDGSSVSLYGDCGAPNHLPSPVLTTSIQLTMDSGGGADGNISFTDDGSGGLIVGYR